MKKHACHQVFSKDQMFGTSDELHAMEEYDKDAKDMKFVTQPARLHYVESFRRIPVVDFNDYAGEEGHDSGGKIVEKGNG